MYVGKKFTEQLGKVLAVYICMIKELEAIGFST